MQLTSSDFEPGGPIPALCTCDGGNASPQLRIVDVPPDTESLVLVMEDPDTPGVTFTHWVLYDMPPTMSEIAPASPPPLPGKVGLNDMGEVGYYGPCPPVGTHRYIFTLYALDTVLALPEGASKQDVANAMDGFVIAKAQLIGTYGRAPTVAA